MMIENGKRKYALRLLKDEIEEKWFPIKELYGKFKNEIDPYTSPYCFDVGEERGCEDCNIPKEICVNGGKGGLVAMFDLHLDMVGKHINKIIKVLKQYEELNKN